MLQPSQQGRLQAGVGVLQCSRRPGPSWGCAGAVRPGEVLGYSGGERHLLPSPSSSGFGKELAGEAAPSPLSLLAGTNCHGRMGEGVCAAAGNIGALGDTVRLSLSLKGCVWVRRYTTVLWTV
jgi:hypothetical protein